MNTIGRYQLVEKLGQGGMGVVYRAFDTLLERVVAVKLIGTSIESSAELRERFFREARAAGQLSHPNIITIYDLGEFEGQPYIAMEYLEGEDLQQRVARPEKMSLARKLELAIDLCAGLEYAHACGVVHRDVKPANIFITAKGATKILDFGLARLITSELTNSNMMMGTLNYMAPEQVRGERADHRSDIFSAGVVLYELFGGKRAFEGDSFASTLYKILQEIPEPLLNIDPTLPPELVAVVERALEKLREERYQQMGDMLRDLTLFQQRMMLLNSPAFGHPVTGVHRVPSDAPRSAPGFPSDAVPFLGPDAPTLAPTASPVPIRSPVSAGHGAAPGSGSSPGAEATGPPWPSDANTRSDRFSAPATRWPAPAIVVSAVAAVVLAGGLLWFVLGRSPQDPVVPTEPAGALDATRQAAIAAAVQQAAEAFQNGDYEAAQRHAETALAQNPDHAEARGISDRAKESADSVARGLANARDLFAAGRYEEASRAAGDVLSVSPGHAEARRIMEDGAERSRGRGAAEARTRMSQAKAAATAAGAPSLAGPAFAAAISAERDAQRLFSAGRLAEATGRFYEASGLFRSAEIAAQTEAVARTERARIAQAERQPGQEPPARGEGAATASGPPAAPRAPQAPPPVAGGAERALPTSVPLPVAPPPAPPVVPPATPAAQPTSESSPPAASPTSQIEELLGRYRAALENRSLESLKQLWPGLGGAQEAAIRTEFQHASRIDVEIVDPRISVSGNAASVSFTRRYQLLTTDNQRLRTETRTTMNLRRSGSGWVIEQMRFEPIR